MTGALVFMFLAALCATGVLLLLAAERRPDTGWSTWWRESVDAWRSDELKVSRKDRRAGDVRDAPLADLFSLGEPVDEPAYARPEELRSTIEQARRQARAVTRR
ncbi:hypothetical protein [Georgenia sp. SYP-B2076]|uniref:hypothetical protein n=1 Tax=Georgenia sp. SYP-B2076 TaxID=2495881 RepID=UPI000F8F0F6D|nr:hypothetical protein [Georgenia sp. SYP-B2076]